MGLLPATLKLKPRAEMGEKDEEKKYISSTWMALETSSRFGNNSIPVRRPSFCLSVLRAKTIAPIWEPILSLLTFTTIQLLHSWGWDTRASRGKRIDLLVAFFTDLLFAFAIVLERISTVSAIFIQYLPLTGGRGADKIKIWRPKKKMEAKSACSFYWHFIKSLA